MAITFVAAAKRPDNQNSPYDTGTIDTTGAILLFMAVTLSPRARFTLADSNEGLNKSTNHAV